MTVIALGRLSNVAALPAERPDLTARATHGRRFASSYRAAAADAPRVTKCSRVAQGFSRAPIDTLSAPWPR